MKTETRRRYGRWAGNPEGVSEDSTRCIAQVSGLPLFYQCLFTRGNGPDGLFCGIHARMLAEGRRPHLLPQDEHYHAKENAR